MPRIFAGRSRATVVKMARFETVLSPSVRMANFSSAVFPPLKAAGSQTATVVLMAITIDLAGKYVNEKMVYFTAVEVRL